MEADDIQTKDKKVTLTPEELRFLDFLIDLAVRTCS
jgi:hypothetical protein